MADDRDLPKVGTRLFSCYMKAEDTEIVTDAVMLCEMVGDEIDTVALRVASGSMKKWVEGE